MNTSFTLLSLIFLLAVVLRFLYFPGNVYLAYDQTRDLYSSLEILHGHLKIIGPPSSASDQLYHGPLIYYIYALFNFFFNNNPEVISAFFRILNAGAIFLVFSIGSLLFNRWVGLIGALLFAASYEQTQYALFLSHPSLAVITVLIFYLGLGLLIFKKDNRGFILTALGLGLSIQFHYVNLSLLGVLFLTPLLIKRDFRPDFKKIFLAGGILITTLSSFILAELKFNFKFTNAFLKQFSLSSGPSGSRLHFKELGYVLERFIHDNFLLFNPLNLLIYLILIFGVTLIYKTDKQKGLFLALWFLMGLVPYLVSGSSSYYYNPAASVSLLLIFAYFLIWLYQKQKLLAGAFLIMVIASNIILVSGNNMGPNKDIIIQLGMLLGSEKEAIDYIYNQSNGGPFTVNAITVPLDVNTTWNYLFEWYGKDKYHYLPVWGGQAAAGYQGNLTVVTNRELLPKKRFTIIESTVGIGQLDQENFLREENYFTKVIEAKKFGTITVQYREPI